MPSAIAQGPPGYRPEMGEAYVRALNTGVVPRVPLQGSKSASDLIPNARLALGVLDVDTLEAKEGGSSTARRSAWRWPSRRCARRRRWWRAPSGWRR